MESLLSGQKNRIKRITSEIDHGLEIEFYVNDVSSRTTDIRFKVKEKSTGRIFGSIPADYEWALSVVTDMNDLELRHRIQALLKR